MRVRRARAIFNDLSADLLGLCRDCAAETGALDRCRFVLGAVDDLQEIDEASVDVVTIRSVLIYVKDKLASLRECYRVLRPGGRLALFEPINRFIVADYGRTFCGYDVSPIDDIVAKLEAVYDAIQDPVDDPMVDFDERDLLVFVTDGGLRRGAPGTASGYRTKDEPPALGALPGQFRQSTRADGW